MITVVSGLPRSGTSMLIQMLAAGGLEPLNDGRRPADADNQRGYFEDERVKGLSRDATWLAEAEGKALKVVVPLVATLPRGFEYRVVLIRRDLDAVLASQGRMLERLGRPVRDATKLRPVFETQIARAVKGLEQRPDCDLLVLEHADVLKVPRAAAEHIATFLGLELDLAAMATAVDPSLCHRRAGIHRRHRRRR